MIIILLTWFFMMIAAIGLILFLIGLVLKLRNKKKKAIVPTILIVLGALFMAPFLIMWIYSIYGTANIVDRRAGSLMHQVEFGTVEDVEHYGKTPLVYVVECKSTLYPEDIQVEIVKLLLEYGADKEVVGRYNDTALEEAREREKYLIEQVLLEE